MSQLTIDIFKNAFDLIDDYIFIKDINYKYIYANKKVCELFNSSLEEVIGKDDTYFFDLGISDDIKVNDTIVIENEKTIENIETNIIIETGQTRYYKSIKQPIYDSQNKLVGLFGLSKDITEQKIAQERLKEKESLLRLVLDENPDVIIMKDFEGKFILVNKTVAGLYQTDPDDMIGKDDGDYIPQEQADFFKKNVQKIMRAGQTEIVYEDSTDVNSGETRHFKSIKKPLKDKDGNDQILVIATDITDLIRMQKALQAEKEKAERATKAKSDFLANMSHEIRTPMTGMLGFVDQLEKDEKDPKRLKQFNIIKNSGQTLLAIINDILDFSKIESGKLELDSSPFSIAELFDSSINIFASLASSQNVNLHNAIDDNLPQCITGDETRLKQIVFNLMSNAVKFTNEKGNVTLQANYDKEAKLIHIAVIDTGVGIAKDNLKNIFEAFSQEDVSTTRKFGGTGLGLSIASQLVQLMGSELKIQSEVGAGSKFYFHLAVEICPDESINKAESSSIDQSGEVSLKGHILVVEDNKTNQLLIGMILDDLGLSYDIADNGAEGVLSFKQNKYDVILMDENMPIMNGIEATKHIRELEEEKSLTFVPIVAVTANALKGDKEKFIAAGMDDYIPKPYSEKDIVKVLQKYLT